MNATALRKLWSFFGVLLSSFSAAFVLRAAAAETDAGWLPLTSFGPYGMTLVVIPVGVAMGGVQLWLTRKYAVEQVGGWASRLPVFYFEKGEIDPQTPDGKKYQAVFLIAFLLWPVACQVVLLLKMLQGTAVVGGRSVNLLEHFWSLRGVEWGAWWGGTYQLDGMSFYPVLQPWLYLGFVTWLVVQLVRTLRIVFD